MTDRLDEIRKRLEAGYPGGNLPLGEGWGGWKAASEDIAYLLAEVGRLNGMLAEKQTDIVDRLEKRMNDELDKRMGATPVP